MITDPHNIYKSGLLGTWSPRLVYKHEFGTDVDYHIVIPFLKAPATADICYGTLVCSI